MKILHEAFHFTEEVSKEKQISDFDVKNGLEEIVVSGREVDVKSVMEKLDQQLQVSCFSKVPAISVNQLQSKNLHLHNYIN